ncbi:MAG: TIGR03067 domain-containing protein [Gemmataceae bacterium]
MRVVLLTLLSALAVAGAGARPDDKAVAADRKAFQGTWAFESVEVAGQKLPADLLKGMTVSFDGDSYSVKQGDKVVESATQTLDPSKSPKALDSKVTAGPNKGATILGIYEIRGDTLTVCFDPEGKERPKAFKADAGTRTLVVHTRVKK